MTVTGDSQREAIEAAARANIAAGAWVAFGPSDVVTLPDGTPEFADGEPDYDPEDLAAAERVLGARQAAALDRAIPQDWRERIGDDGQLAVAAAANGAPGGQQGLLSAMGRSGVVVGAGTRLWRLRDPGEPDVAQITGRVDHHLPAVWDPRVPAAGPDGSVQRLDLTMDTPAVPTGDGRVILAPVSFRPVGGGGGGYTADGAGIVRTEQLPRPEQLEEAFDAERHPRGWHGRWEAGHAHDDVWTPRSWQGSRPQGPALSQAAQFMNDVFISDGREDPVGQLTLRAYAADDYRQINGALRAGKVEGRVARQVAEIDSLLEHVRTATDVLVFRGFPKGIAEGWQPGQVISDPGYLSTALMRGTAARFARRDGGSGVVAEIHLPPGTPAVAHLVGVQHHLDEPEVVLPRGTQLRVVSVDRGVVRLEVAPHDDVEQFHGTGAAAALGELPVYVGKMRGDKLREHELYVIGDRLRSLFEQYPEVAHPQPFEFGGKTRHPPPLTVTFASSVDPRVREEILNSATPAATAYKPGGAGQQLVLNDLEDLTAVMSAADGVAPSTRTWEGITTHEFGHAFARVHGLGDNGQMALALEKFGLTPPALRRVSLYATADAGEGFAELFGMAHTPGFGIPGDPAAAQFANMERWMRSGAARQWAAEWILAAASKLGGGEK